MSASYTDPGARELARRLAALSSGKKPEPSGRRVTVSEAPDERLARFWQLALNAAPVVLPALGKLVPRRRTGPEIATPPAGRKRRRKPFFNRWRMYRLGALGLGVVYLFRGRIFHFTPRHFALGSARVRVD